MPNSQPSSQAYPGEPTLLVKEGPDSSPRASEQHKDAVLLTATLAEARTPLSVDPLHFHELSAARQSSSPELRAMADTSHRLVDHNLVRSEDVAGLRVRHTDMQNPSVTAALKQVDLLDMIYASNSNFNLLTRGITIVEQDADRFRHEQSAPEALKAFLFAHELGHALHIAQEYAELLKNGPPSPAELAASPTNKSEWVLMAEMRADLFALASTAVTKGTAEASVLADVILVSREREHANWLTLTSEKPRDMPPLNDHHTSAAIAEFKTQLAAGRFSDPQTPEGFNQALSDMAAIGLRKELAQVPGNWLGGHQIGPDNELKPLSPDVRAALLESTRQNEATGYAWDRAHVRLVMEPEVARQVVQPGAPSVHTERLEVQGKSYTVLSVQPPATLSLPAQDGAFARTLKIDEASLGINQAAKAQTLELERLVTRGVSSFTAEPKQASLSRDYER